MAARCDKECLADRYGEKADAAICPRRACGGYSGGFVWNGDICRVSVWPGDELGRSDVADSETA